MSLKSKKRLALLVAVVLCLSLVLAGCSTGADTPTPTPTDAAVTGSPAPSTDTPADEDTPSDGDTREIIDMAGRTVTIPSTVTKVMGAANPDGMILYTIDPTLMVGWTAPPSEAAAAYMDPTAAALPQITSVSIWEAPNKEEILNIAPDFILAVIDIQNSDLTMYDELSAELGVPIVIAEATLSTFADTCTFLGDVLGREEQCAALAAYTTDLLQDIEDTMAKVDEADCKTVYYGTGSSGIQTSGNNNWHGEFIYLAGGVNVCDVEQDSGHAEVSMEQILAWNPQVIIENVGAENVTLFTSEAWADIDAVQNHQVYTVPTLPFNWVDKPTGINRLIGVKWVNSVLYPDAVTYDIVSDVIEFYDLFYHYSMTEEEAAQFLDTQLDY